MTSRVGSLSLLVLVPVTALAQRERAQLPPLHHEAVTFDAARGRPVVYGGSDSIQGTWAWEGGRWRQIVDSSHSPPRRDGATMGYDPKHRQLFFFGGWLGSPWQSGHFTLHCDTWTFDGTAWTRRNSAPCFTDRVRNNSLVYDTRRDVMLLVDGTPEVPPAPLRSLRLWRWINEGWELLDSAGPRRPGWDQAVYDESRQVLVMPVFDGPDTGVWEWNGSRWRTVRASGPTPRHVYGLAYDPRLRRIVMIGGQTYTRPQLFLDDSWTWDGTRWSPLPSAAANTPARRAGGTLMTDAENRRLLYFGGYAGPPLRLFQELWQFDQRGWRTAAGVGDSLRPPPRGHHALSYNPASRRVVLFGGIHLRGDSAPEILDDLWGWNGKRWTMIATSTGQPKVGHPLFADGQGGLFMVGDAGAMTARWSGERWDSVAEGRTAGAAAAWDPVRKRFVLFGGSVSASQYSAETWEFDGTRWERRDAPGPSARLGASMVYDAHRRVMVLFGGKSVSRTKADGTREADFYGDTWEWNGTVWSQVAAAGPSPRSSAGMAYDARRRETVLFGGGDRTNSFNETWLWNGRHWRRAQTSSSPSARSETFLAYDAARAVTVMFGGAGGPPPATLGDTWEWDGRSWRNMTPTRRASLEQ